MTGDSGTGNNGPAKWALPASCCENFTA